MATRRAAGLHGDYPGLIEVQEPARPSRLRFGLFELDARSGELRRDGALVHLPPQPFKVLWLLASRSGEVVSREEIRQELWGQDTFVDFDGGLNFCINQIRKALRDSAESSPAAPVSYRIVSAMSRAAESKFRDASQRPVTVL